jgi:hypothetical protein
MLIFHASNEFHFEDPTITKGPTAMHTTPHEHAAAPSRAESMSRPLKIALLMVALIGGFYLLREHWNHVAGNWIYLILLACPLMHLFHGHGGHGGRGGHKGASDKPPEMEG